MGCGRSKTDADSNKATVIFVLGGPGSGKGTQCGMLKEKHGFLHVSTGDLLREEVKSKGPDGELIDKVQKEGGLVDSKILVNLCLKEIKKSPGKVILLDGFPRSQENCNVWKEIIGDKANSPFLLYFNCSQETMKKRLLGRNQGRADDNEEAIMKRFKTFESQTVPILAEFEKQKKVEKVEVEKDKEAIFADIVKIFKARKLIA